MPTKPEAASATSRNEVVLSVEETNQLRQKLGLRPLDVDSNEKEASISAKPTSSSAAVLSEEEIRQRVQQKKQNRLYESLISAPSIAEEARSDTSVDLNPLAWVQQMRKKQSEKHLLPNPQHSISVDRVVYSDEEDEKPRKGANLSQFSTASNSMMKNEILSTMPELHVCHNIEDFKENKTILHLADMPLLSEQGDLVDEVDRLENCEIRQTEIREKNLKESKKKSVYDPVWQFESTDIEGPKKDILEHYDEWVEGAKPKDIKKGFSLHSLHQEQSPSQSSHTKRQLEKNEKMDAFDYRPQAILEMNMSAPVAIKKRKKAAGLKKFTSISQNFEPTDVSHGSKHSTGDNSKNFESTPIPFVIESTAEEKAEAAETKSAVEDEDDEYLYDQLAKRRASLKAQKSHDDPPIQERYVSKIKGHFVDTGEHSDLLSNTMEQIKQEPGIDLTSTTEFCRSVQTPLEKLRAYESESFSGSTLYRKQKIEEQKIMLERRRKDHAHSTGADSDMEMSDEELDSDQIKLEDEDLEGVINEKALDGGIASALSYLREKDDICDFKLRVNRSNKDNAPMHTSTKEGDIKLDYQDQFGRAMTPKEAFRHISWIFHGKGPGRKKLEKRLMRIELEKKLKQISADSMPTMQALRKVQKQSGSAHVVLSHTDKN